MGEVDDGKGGLTAAEWGILLYKEWVGPSKSLLLSQTGFVNTASVSGPVHKALDELEETKPKGQIGAAARALLPAP